MSLNPGTRLGPYEILSAIGAGGMGEVYRARDTRLQRDVAVKVLPAALSSDPDRLARFEQEARAAAALSHPNILAVHDLGSHDGAPYIVSELLEGSTLREQIPGLPVRKAIDYAIQIARGLAAAHDKGIVHRDLKPENIFVTSDGRAKILDFGLAKLTQAEPVAAGMSALPTTPVFPAHAPQTIAGFVLGTVGYMAPEQVRGVSADHRADIFAFGAILYEMLSGHRAFGGDTAMDTMMAIAKESPPDLPFLERHISLALRRIVDRCLEKHPASRFQSADDLAFALEGLSTSTASGEAQVIPAQRRWLTNHPAAAWAVAALTTAIAVGAAITAWSVRSNRSSQSPPIARLTVALPAGDDIAPIAYPQLALSPDGRHLVYGATRGGKLQLFLREIDQLDSRPLPGTEGAVDPFFSPNGEWVGFFAQGKLQKISIAAGALQTLCDAPGNGGRGGSWGPDDIIYFAPTNIGGIWKVPASGGTPEQVTRLDRAKGEISHRWPQLLPGGKALLFTVWTGPGGGEERIDVQSLSNGERHVLVRGASMARYVSTGHLVYTRNDALMALPMDLDRLQVASIAPIPLAESIRAGDDEGAQFEVSNGTLAYVAGSPRRLERRLVWVDRRGTVEKLDAPTRHFSGVSISPDGHQAAVNIIDETETIWVYDFARSTLTPIATGTGSSQSPMWSPDGSRIWYRGTRTGVRNLFWKTVDDARGEERLTTKENVVQTPGSISSDGKWLAFTENGLATGSDLWVMPLDGDRKPRPLSVTSSDEFTPRFSPDGRWIAFESNESGRFEIYVQPFPGPGGKRVISTNGGRTPVWSRNGRELFFLDGDTLMAVDITPSATGLAVSKPHVLFEGHYVADPTLVGTYDVSSDSQRFLRIEPTEPEPPTNQVQVVLNWFDELKRVTPAK